MTVVTDQRTRSEQIGDILTAFEHLWKMYPDRTFSDVAEEVLGVATDDEVEVVLRAKLRDIMKGTRDRT